MAFAEYVARQAQHRAAEIAALHDTARFIARAAGLYGYQNFVCDTSGSICEVVNPEDPACPVLTALQQNLLLVWIKGSDGHKDALVRRFDRAPKPMYYQPAFLQSLWAEYLAAMQQTEAQVDPDAFLRFGYARLLDHRQPRYAALARWGVTVLAEDVSAVQNPADLNRLIARALDQANVTKANTDA